MTQTLKDIKMLKGATLGVEFLDILSMNSEQLSRSNSRKPSRAVSQTGFSTLLSPSDSTAPSRLSIKRTLTNIEVYNTKGLKDFDFNQKADQVIVQRPRSRTREITTKITTYEQIEKSTNSDPPETKDKVSEEVTQIKAPTSGKKDVDASILPESHVGAEQIRRRQDLVNKRKLYTNIASYLHVLVIILTFFVAVVEIEDISYSYFVEITNLAKKYNLTYFSDIPPNIVYGGNDFDCNIYYSRRCYVVWAGRIMTLISVILVILHSMAYKDFLQLVCISNSASGRIASCITKRSEFLVFYLLEIFVSILHPACWIDGVNFCTWPILYLASLLRLFLLLELFYFKSPFLSSSMNEMTAIFHDIQLTNSYIQSILTCFKVAGERYPWSLFTAHFMFVWMISGLFLCLVETSYGLSHALIHTNEISYKLNDCLWLIPSTMLTVGYGDMVPHSFIGKCICMMAAGYGVFMSARMVILHENGTKMTKREKIVYNLIIQREMKKQMRNKAAILIQRAWRSRTPKPCFHDKVLKVLRSGFNFGFPSLRRGRRGAIVHTRTGSKRSAFKRQESFLPPPQNANTNCSIINSKSVLLGMMDFKKIRLQCKYHISDKTDIMDIGIKIEVIEGRLEALITKMKKLQKSIARIESHYESMADALNFLLDREGEKENEKKEEDEKDE